ncbi:hypothetical protein Tcan_03994 [Toxocara canis]|uniref:Uncharacterized protein n=1 Tax=Toxocara canis TaxID=6265 RepID=A0A0B2VCH6_TOXCA|nr:hypothetical protein Tcan_03994 [Toxocara canis]
MAKSVRASSEMKTAVEDYVAMADGMRKVMEHKMATMVEEMRNLLLTAIRNVGALQLHALKNGCSPILQSVNSSCIAVDAEQKLRRSTVFIGIDEASGAPQRRHETDVESVTGILEER